MKKKAKKWMAAALAAAACVSLTACGGTDTQEGNTAETAIVKNGVGGG